MEYAAAMAALPGDDALALFLADAGAPEQVIADRLEIDPESVGPLLEVARRKLAAQLRLDAPQQSAEATPAPRAGRIPAPPGDRTDGRRPDTAARS